MSERLPPTAATFVHDQEFGTTTIIFGAVRPAEVIEPIDHCYVTFSDVPSVPVSAIHIVHPVYSRSEAWCQAVSGLIGPTLTEYTHLVLETPDESIAPMKVQFEEEEIDALNLTWGALRWSKNGGPRSSRRAASGRTLRDGGALYSSSPSIPLVVRAFNIEGLEDRTEWPLALPQGLTDRSGNEVALSVAGSGNEVVVKANGLDVIGHELKIGIAHPVRTVLRSVQAEPDKPLEVQFNTGRPLNVVEMGELVLTIANDTRDII